MGKVRFFSPAGLSFIDKQILNILKQLIILHLISNKGYSMFLFDPIVSEKFAIIGSNCQCLEALESVMYDIIKIRLKRRNTTRCKRRKKAPPKILIS